MARRTSKSINEEAHANEVLKKKENRGTSALVGENLKKKKKKTFVGGRKIITFQITRKGDKAMIAMVNGMQRRQI
uniref:Uncharacterized protein n=1 Tax=Caenorhabditis japonica TaxID=281687 RepID=A0A8R1IPK4_CAEJA